MREDTTDQFEDTNGEVEEEEEEAEAEKKAGEGRFVVDFLEHVLCKLQIVYYL